MLTPDKQTASYNYDGAYTGVHQYDVKKPLTEVAKTHQPKCLLASRNNNIYEIL